jgi:hypothetical protein
MQEHPISITVGSTIIAVLAGLATDILASYLIPAFENRSWLAVDLSVLVLTAHIWLTVYQEHGTWLPLPVLLPTLNQATGRKMLTILLSPIQWLGILKILLKNYKKRSPLCL